MEWDRVLKIGPLGYKIVKKLWEDLGEINATQNLVLDALILSTRRYLGKIFKDYELAVIQEKQNTTIKASIIKDKDVAKAIAGLNQFEVHLLEFAARAKKVIKIIEVLL